MPLKNLAARRAYDNWRNNSDPKRVAWKKIYQKAWWERNKEKDLARKRTSHGRVLRRASEKRKRLRYKLQAFDAYGGRKCACCGESELGFLSLDHINGKTAEEKKQASWRVGGTQLYKRLKREGWPAGFQVLCMNCNWGKRLYGVCPHVIRVVDEVE